MATKPLPSQEVLRQLLDYDPETGALTWRERSEEHYTAKCRSKRRAAARRFNAQKAGLPALSTPNGNGYLRGRLAGSNQYAHRVAWKWMTGREPLVIDHIDNNPKNNSWVNLRAVTQKENMRNCRVGRNNRSGATGVFQTDAGWRAGIGVSYRNIHLGTFATRDDAIAARKSAEKRYWK